MQILSKEESEQSWLSESLRAEETTSLKGNDSLMGAMKIHTISNFSEIPRAISLTKQIL